VPAKLAAYGAGLALAAGAGAGLGAAVGPLDVGADGPATHTTHTTHTTPTTVGDVPAEHEGH
jgi:hypothetical protein